MGKYSLEARDKIAESELCQREAAPRAARDWASPWQESNCPILDPCFRNWSGHLCSDASTVAAEMAA